MLTKEEILDLLASGETKKAIAALMEATRSDEDLYDEVVLISNRYKQWEKNEVGGRVDFASLEVNHNNIVEALTKIAHKLPVDNKINPKFQAIRLTRPKEDIRRDINQLIERGNIILEILKKSPPGSQSELYEMSAKYWHDGWRVPLEQIITISFSPLKPLKWLQKIPLLHKNYGAGWKQNAKDLQRDIETEMAFLQDLLARLDNYQES